MLQKIKEDIYQTDDLDKINYNDLKIGDQIILIQNRYNEILEKKVNQIKNLILSNVRFNSLYTFSCIKNKIIEPQYEHKKIGYKNEVENKQFLIINNKPYRVFRDRMSPHDNFDYFNFTKDIYTNIFNKKNTINNPFVGSITNDNDEEIINKIQYISIPISNDSIIVFYFNHHISNKKLLWNANKGIMILNDNEESLFLSNSNFRELLDKLVNNNQIKSKLYDKFFNYRVLYNYNCQEHLNNYSKEKIKLIKNEFGNDIFNRFYKPFYKDKALNIKAYLRNNYEYNSGYIIKHDNKTIKCEKAYKPEIEEQLKIIKAMYKFKTNYNGVNPETGDYYKGGEKNNEYILYKDKDGILVNAHHTLSGSYDIYLKIKGYFIYANSTIREMYEDKLNCLQERFEIVNEMTKINKE
jgi:hypothetical protein